MWLYVGVVGSVVLLCAAEVFSIVSRPPGVRSLEAWFYVVLIYLSLSATGVLALFVCSRPDVGVVLILCLSNAVAGYVGGQVLPPERRHQLAPKISPQKTFEGYLCGVLVCMIVAPLLHMWLSVSPYHPRDSGFWLVEWHAFLIANLETIGDLTVSRFKRLTNRKDTVLTEIPWLKLPGHGGFLDRFDGLIMVFLFQLYIVPFFRDDLWSVCLCHLNY